MADLSMAEFFNTTKRNKLLHYTDQPGAEDVSKGEVRLEKYDNNYNVQNAIKVAGPVDPQDFDSPVYNRERIFENLERMADVINVVNPQPLGGQQLFVIQSHKSVMEFSHETPVDPQQIQQFYKIYEIRLRSQTSGQIYRVTTYPVRSIS